ncbi:cytochrome c oxidase subunit 2 [Dulcicalothrix desertica PCC 7102]|uniref:Cytochrome c oxidase subunit 2 n=1 Tax=Dulcicalothrix desertica PCC 7102 TaxID=232991 RepID=A0A3S1CH02_9CYAN|nr:cytochrome c oxidase subunit II [Dulcicalothrix desertica]RUT07138.1 cytochrome c oxidase subunit 2 [Dulcicalothrix desertica PCC 7102]TWH61865.1 cytochrome c oxidase subunit 2 [Dulcicalothrix desertica PCC 7102]
MQQVPVSLLTLVAGILVTLVSIWVGQHSASLLPVQASEQAPLVDRFFQILVGIGTALFLIVQGAIVLFMFQYRQRQGDDRDGTLIEGNFPLEIFWTAIPSIIVIGLGIYSVDVYTQMGGLSVGHHSMAEHAAAPVKGTALAGTLSETSDIEALTEEIPKDEVIPEPARAETSLEEAPVEAPLLAPIEEPITLPVKTPIKRPVKKLVNVPQPGIGIGANPKVLGNAADLVVNVTGMQFAWIFNYPETDITSGELHVPVGADVQVNLAASDVIHSLWIPQFRLKQDAIPGQATGLRFKATRPGTYPIVCAELCGGYHGSMRSQVIVHTPDEYQEWLESNRIASAQNQQIAAALQTH